MLFLTRITLFKYRLQLTGFELPADVLASQLELDRRLAVFLERMADRMEREGPMEDLDLKDAFDRLEKAVLACCSEGTRQSTAVELKTLLALSRTAESLLLSLEDKIAPA
jgi:hypothetical protein